MNLQCEKKVIGEFRSNSQIARVLTEAWCSRELYCPACTSDRLTLSKECPECDQPFQLKSLKKWNSRKIVDAGYEAMISAIRADRTPNLLILQYSSDWHVDNLLLVPRMFFTESIVEKRRPLSIQARRAGWVGCNILLSQIPEDGKISLISNCAPISEELVRAEFSRIRGLTKIPPSVRGWTLDILKFVRELKKTQFSLQEMYRFEGELKKRHPRNQNIRSKIRQQLQVLRDLGIVRFLAPGQYLMQR